MPRVYRSPDSVRSSARISRGQRTSGQRDYTRTNGRVTAYGGTPVPPSKGPQQARRRSVRVRKALNRVEKAYSKGSLPGLDSEQSKVLNTVLNTGRKMGASRKELLAATETGLVESNLRNLSYGDRDSLGWRQERAGQYGAENATNVKGGAKRFFEESKTDTSEAQHRGRGMTAGQLAQAIQGSAFPERYDQMKPQAKALLKASERKVKVKPKDAKLLKRAGVSTKKPKPTVEKKPGPWAGSQKAVLSKVPKATRPEGRGDKRTPAENVSVGGATNSDHLTTNQKSYAADLPPDDATAKHIAQKLGMASHTGTNQVVKDGYEYTLIWQDAGHYDHIHIGAEWVGKGVPPGTTLGGPSGGNLLVSSGGSGGGGGSPGTPGRTKQKGPSRKQKLRRIQAAFPDTADAEASLADLERRYGAVTV